MDDDAFDSTVLVRDYSELEIEWHVIVVMDDKAITHTLPSSGEVTIGRFTGSKLIVNHDTLSRFHAVLRIGPGPVLTIEDLGSANGTFVREVRVQPGKHVQITTGDVVRLGAVILIFRH